MTSGLNPSFSLLFREEINNSCKLFARKIYNKSQSMSNEIEGETERAVGICFVTSDSLMILSFPISI